MARVKNIALRILCSIAFIAFAASTSFAQEIEVIARLDSTSIKIGEQTRIHLSAKAGPGVKLKWPDLKDTITGHIEIVEKGKINSTGNLQEQNIIITSFDSGFHVIPPFRFIVNGDTSNIEETEALLLQVNTVPIDTAQASVKDIKGIMDEPFNWREAIPYVLWGLAILAAIALIVWGIVKLAKKKPAVAAKPKIIVPPHVKALQQLERLRGERLWQEGKVKQYHSALSDIVRAYIEERFKVHALEQTTDEILTSFRTVVVDNESKSKLKQLLTLADLVKFAKEEPLPQENELSMSNAFDFVVGTKREEPVPGTGINEIKGA